MVFLLIVYMWLFVHRPFEVWPILGSLRIERVYMIIILVCWFFFFKKNFLTNRATVALLVLFAGIMLSEYMHLTNGVLSKTTEDWLKVFLFSILIITSIQTENELKILLTGFCFIFFIYLAHSLWEFHFNNRHVYRMGTYRMIGVDEAMNDPNSFGASVVYAIPMLIPLWHLKGKSIWLGLGMKLFAVLFFLVALTCIIRTGSRSAFVGAILVLVILAMISKHRIQWLIVLCAVGPLVWVCMDENLQNRYLTIIDPSRGPRSAQESVEGRKIGFRVGVETWQKYPVFGVGPGNSSKYSPLKLQLHNFVAQVIAELGTVGAIAYIIVILSMASNFLLARKYYHLHRILKPPGNEYLYFVSVATMITLFELLLLGTGAHNAYRYNWVWYTAFQGISVMLIINQLRDTVAENKQKCL